MKWMLLLVVVLAIGCGGDSKQGMEPCEVCGESVSVKTDECPYCGEPNPTKGKKKALLALKRSKLKARIAELEHSIIVEADKLKRSELELERDAVKSELSELPDDDI